jgi:protein involved in polysaccharide export with SLBB domain
MAALAALHAMAQDPTALLTAAQQARPGEVALEPAFPAHLPAWALGTAGTNPGQRDDPAPQRSQNERLDQEIKKAKAKEKGPARFAADLFETRQYGINPTDGGISEDYVLGVGDRLQMNVVGSATFDTVLQVDGRGGVVIPKVGTVAVAGMSLGRARAAVQQKVAQFFSRSTVDLSVTRLREVRVFVLGEVYQPGSYLVPSLSSIINILSLAGGPTQVGSYRDIRVVRGGRLVHAVDLYPLRAEGLGNLNFGFQNGDTLFVPLIQNQVQLEGAFTRVVATVPGKPSGPDQLKDTEEERRVKRLIRQLQARLGVTPDQPRGGAGAFLQGEKGAAVGLAMGGAPRLEAKAEGAKENLGLDGLAGGNNDLQTSTPLTALDRAELEDRLELLQQHLLEIKSRSRGDQRIAEDADNRPNELAGQPAWLSSWLLEGRTPVMQFEMRPGETVKDVLGFAGGFALQAFSGSVTLRRVNISGALSVVAIPAGEAMAKCVLQRGDVLTALPLRDHDEGAVSVRGWARVQGLFARKEGQRLGDLLKELGLVLPDTYLERGELVRSLPDGSKRYQSFDVAKALAGNEAHNLPLANRDAIELYRVGDLRLPLTLSVLGPVTRPGTFEFIKGMRASDLLFRAGVPLKSADRFVAELAHIRDGKSAEVKRLDLTLLVSRVGSSPVDLQDDAVNPMLEPYDQLTVYAKPDFRLHRTITLSGQVVRPGSYELETPRTSLREVLKRAGGLTAEAMVSGGIFLRPLGGADPEKNRVNIIAGVENADPTSNGVNDILRRLSETKRMPITGTLLNSPLMHGLTSGSLNRMVVNLGGILAGDPSAEVELQDGDEIIIPRRTEVAYVVGETASPFASYKVRGGMKVKDLLGLAGGPTRNADTSHIRLLKADGRIMDRRVKGRVVEPGDAVLVPQRIRRDVSWQENLAALTPLAVMINALRK